MKTLADGTRVAENDADWTEINRQEDAREARKEAMAGTDSAETELVNQYRNAQFIFEEVATKVNAHFMRLIAEAKNRAEGMAIVRRCPDDVTKAFMLDHLSHVKKFP